MIRGRGAADDALTLNDWNYAVKAQSDLGPGVWPCAPAPSKRTAPPVRSGPMRANAATGQRLTYASSADRPRLGLAAAGLAAPRNLYNTSVSIALNRQSHAPPTTSIRRRPPATASTARCAGEGAGYDFELGGDVRAAEGDDHELFHYVAGALTQNRDAGGQHAGRRRLCRRRPEPWVLASHRRHPRRLLWNSTDGHRIESNVSNGSSPSPSTIRP